jgi:hypothetical protein
LRCYGQAIGRVFSGAQPQPLRPSPGLNFDINVPDKLRARNRRYEVRWGMQSMGFDPGAFSSQMASSGGQENAEKQ